MKHDDPKSPDILTGGETSTGGVAKSSRMGGIVRALKHRNYQLFFSGQLISLVGTWMQSVAESWLIYRLTGSSVLLGFIGFCGQIPIFLLAPIGGAVADRFSRHRILIITQTTSMILVSMLAAVTLLGTVQPWHIFALGGLLGVVNAFDIPARQAFVVEMVGKEDLVNAIALNSSMVNGARILGPAIAGVLVGVVGEGWCFLSNSVSYLGVITGLLLMKVVPRAPKRREGSALSHISQGFRFAGKTRPVRAILLLLGAISLLGMPYAVLMPIFADKILHGGPSSLGLLMGASGVGALCGALLLAARRGVKGLGNWIAWASMGFGACIILFSFSRVLWLSVLFLIPTGFSMMVQMASSNTLVQMMVPDELRGRVMAVYSMMFMGMAPLGALLAGVLADSLGAPETVALGGAVCILGALVFKLYLPGLRGEARALIVAQGMVGGEPAQDMVTQGVPVH